MLTRLLTLPLAGLALTSAHAQTVQEVQYLYATNVPDRGGWNFEDRCEGEPSDLDCNDNNYAATIDNMTVDWLAARDFDTFVFDPACEVITGVYVDLMQRYRIGEDGTTWLRLSLGVGNPIDGTSACFHSGPHGNCRWRFYNGNGYGWDVTNLVDWNADPSQIQRIDLLTRRITTNTTCNSTTRLRVKAFRIVVVTERSIADCDQNGTPDCEELSPTTDEDGDDILDVCDCESFTFCMSLPNSTGSRSRAFLVGGPSLGDGLAKQFRVLDAPAGVFGLFFVGSPSAPMPAGNGMRCLAASGLIRGPVLSTSGNGGVNQVVDFGAAPYNVFGPGDLFALQFVHRDTVGAGFNWSNASQIRLCL
ncbi:MAG: hypothetical protein GY711_23980 [bacterium]|nr:hypothetical protein [bacterium]